MALAESKVTAQGQISVPAEVRRRLGIGPGSVMEWYEQDGEILVRRAVKFSSEDIHRAVFEKPPEAKSLKELKLGVGRHMRRRHPRR